MFVSQLGDSKAADRLLPSSFSSSISSWEAAPKLRGFCFFGIP